MGDKRRIPEFLLELQWKESAIFQPVPQLGSILRKEYKFNQALWFESLQSVSQFHILRFLLKWLKLSKISLISNVDFQVI